MENEQNLSNSISFIDMKSEYEVWINEFIMTLNETINNKDLGSCLWLLVVLSRKGPMLFEYIQDRISEIVKEKNKVLVVTEIALPFISKVFKENRRVLIVDDALYYGTTAKSVAKEIIEFKNFFNHDKNKIDALTIIKSSNLVKDISKYINIKTKTEVSISKSHYFIEKLVDNFHSLNKQFEVEFPIIEYKVKDISKLKFDSLIDEFTKKFNNDIVYKVKDSINIVCTSKSNSSLFRKFRILLDLNNQILRVMPISTEVIPSNLNYYDMMFDTNDERLKTLWCQIFEHIRLNKTSLDLIRNRQERSLIVLANYIMSLNFYLEYRNRIEDVLLNSLNIQNKGELSKLDLRYIVGDDELVELLSDYFTYIRDNEVLSPKLNIIEKVNSVPYQVFENKETKFSAQDIDNMEYKNALMLKNCTNLYEMLSVLFFNQDYILEKRSRNEYNPTADRLKFGYTFDALIEIVKQYIIEANDKNIIKKIHRWVDERIDKSSIVPQYIIDDKLNSWMRVFRPGENEDIQLSHLTRFVLFVFQSVPNYMQYEWIKRSYFEKLLVVAYHCLSSDKIINSDLMEIEISCEDNNDSYLYIYYKEEQQTNKRKVIDYLINMFVLEGITLDSEKKEVMVRISPRMYDGDLMFGTTFSQQIMEEIVNKVSEEWERLNA